MTDREIGALVKRANAIVRGRHEPHNGYQDRNIVANTAEGPVIAAVFNVLVAQEKTPA